MKPLVIIQVAQLPERSAEVLSTWLGDHPGVTVISRDRSDAYAKVAMLAAPEAIQVADRWHLLHNLQDAMVRAVSRHHRQVREAAQAMANREAIVQEASCQTSPVTHEGPRPSPVSMRISRAEQLKQIHRQQRLARYEQVMGLHRQGLSLRTIARRLGMHRRTIRRFVQAGSFPERVPRESSSQIDPFDTYLRQHWDEGCHNAAKLTQELASRGFQGSYHTVRRRVMRWRSRNRTLDQTPQRSGINKSIRTPSPRRVACWLVQPRADLKPYPQAFLEALYERCGALKRTADLAQAFAQMVRQRRVDLLAPWLEQACEDHVAAELRGFAKGLEADEAAVRAALSLEWSSGQVEGQINRLKLIKRQMYGRAKFDLLRQRFLHAG